MKISVRDIQREGRIELEENVPPDLIPLETPDEPRLEGPVLVRVNAEVQDGKVWAWVDAKASLTVNCARCLSPYKFGVHPVFDVETPLDQEFLDVNDELRQQLLLALPVKPLCRARCRGLCVRCGVNLNSGDCGCPKDAGETSFDVLKNLKLK